MSQGPCDGAVFADTAWQPWVHLDTETEQDPMGLLGTKAFLCPLP